MRIDPLDLALNGGEDYGLVFTAPNANTQKLIDRVKKSTGTKVTIIGEIRDKRSGIVLADWSDRERRLLSGGYEHLRGNR